jgi:hypothetical protein
MDMHIHSKRSKSGAGNAEKRQAPELLLPLLRVDRYK